MALFRLFVKAVDIVVLLTVFGCLWYTCGNTLHHRFTQLCFYIVADGEDGEDADTHNVMRELERRVEMIDMMRRSRQSNPLLDTDGGRSYRAAEEGWQANR